MAQNKDIRMEWEEKAQKAFLGKRVVRVRYLKDTEMQALGWRESVLVLEFEDGTLIFPSQDDEGNGGGAMFGQGPSNEELLFPVIRGYMMRKKGAA